MRASLFVLLVFSLPATSFAQVQTGTPKFGSYGGSSVDTINLGNLNAHITIPIISKAGRGTPFQYNLQYDSSVWYPVGSSGSQSWQAVHNWGWIDESQPPIGSLNYASSTLTCYILDHGVEVPVGYRTTESNFAYVDPSGTRHAFSGTDVSVSGQDCGTPSDTVGGYALDGSGYYLAGPSGPVTAPGGTVITPLINGTGTGSVADTNGNEISLSSSGVFTDTLGTTVLTVAGSSPNPETFTYTNPSGQTSQYTVKFSPYTVATNFGVSGISEFGATAESLVSSIVLPDNSQYTFTYEPTPSTPSSGACTPISGTYSNNCVTARIASVQLPTGGTITYAYSGGNNGILSDGSTATLKRSTPDTGSNYWTYAHSESGTAWTTTITDPQGNNTVLNFQGIHQTEGQVYEGSISPSNLLKTVFTCYNGAAPNCNSTAITLPIKQESVYTQWPSGLELEASSLYNSNGLLTEEDDYDYGNPSPGSLLRKTLTSYASLGNGIIDRPASIAVENGSGATVAQDTFGYDAGTVTTISGTPQHVAVSGSRGNLTSVSYLVQNSTTLSKSFTYFDTGNVQTATDVNGAPTTYTYGTCGNSFPTSVAEPLSLSKSMTWNCNGGVLTSLTDENTQQTTYTYNDPNFWRTTATTDQEKNTTNFAYATTPPFSVESTLNFNGSMSTADILKTLDGLGRVRVTQQKESPSSSNFDSVETDYDSLGRPSRVTVPYSGTAGQTNSSAPATATTYDALNRPSLITDGGGGTVGVSYSANDVLQTIGPQPSGENMKRRQFEYNGMGMLTSVCEVTGLTGSGTCAQNTSATGYWTQYAYDARGDLTGVTQDAQSGTKQSRSYTYDGLGRLTSETNPETGAKYYFYDTDPGTKGSTNCPGTYNGDLVKRVDAAGNVTCYAYDALHRATSITYAGPNAPNTPNKYFLYDSATVNSVPMANAEARLAEAYTATCSTCSKITDLGFSYTARGEVQDVYESTPHSGGYFHVDETYWANGALDQISGLSGLPTLTYSPDGEGRANTVSASSGQNPVSGTSYNVASEATQLNLGSGDNDAFGFDPNTFRMTQYQFNVNGQSVTGKLGWNANSTLASLDITGRLQRLEHSKLRVWI
jgi:YD repeat-containing protein